MPLSTQQKIARAIIKANPHINFTILEGGKHEKIACEYQGKRVHISICKSQKANRSNLNLYFQFRKSIKNGLEASFVEVRSILR